MSLNNGNKGWDKKGQDGWDYNYNISFGNPHGVYHDTFIYQNTGLVFYGILISSFLETLKSELLKTSEVNKEIDGTMQYSEMYPRSFLV